MENGIPLTPQEKAKDRRLWKCYRWTLARYNALGELQGWRCYGCGKHKDEKSLNLDHEHFRITACRVVSPRPPFDKWWEATTTLKDGRYFFGTGHTRVQAIANLKNAALPNSVRGFLCRGRHGLGCNTKLVKIDDPIWLAKMIEYLKDPPAKRLK